MFLRSDNHRNLILFYIKITFLRNVFRKKFPMPSALRINTDLIVFNAKLENVFVKCNFLLLKSELFDVNSEIRFKMTLISFERRRKSNDNRIFKYTKSYFNRHNSITMKIIEVKIAQIKF